MKFFPLSATVAATLISLAPSLYTPAIASDPDYACFITTSSGRVLDLSDSLCHTKKSSQKDADNPDKAFIEAYKEQAMSYPEVRDNLIARVQRSPEANIDRAKSVCSDLRAGLTMDEIREDQADENTETANVVNTTIIDSLATKYYCPEISN
jgi:hypothetical protein